MTDADALTAPRPHDDRAEAALLGAILIGHPLDRLNLTADDFYQTRNGDIWAQCQRIADSGRKPDATLVQAALGVHAIPYLADLIGAAGMGPNVPSYARTIAGHADARRLMDIALGVFQQASTGTAAEQVTDYARTALDRLERRTGSVHRLDEVIPGLLDAIEKGGTRGPALPWVTLNRVLRGLQPGRLYTVGARPGVGKSLFGQAVAWHYAHHHGRDVFVASLEMPAQEYAMRFLAAESGVTLRDLESGDLADWKWQMIAGSVQKMQGVPLWLCDDDTQTVRSIAANAKTAARGGNLGLIVVDYLQLLDPENKRAEREQQVADITKRLKRTAKRLHCPVVLLAQLNRESVKGPKRRPELSDLRESGAIEQDSDAVILLHRLDDPDEQRRPDDPVQLEAIVAKNRSGPSRVSAQLTVYGNLARLTDRDIEEQTP